jgi:hypothetical protein
MERKNRVEELRERMRAYLRKNGAQKKATMTRLAYRAGYLAGEIEHAYSMLQDDLDVGYWFDMNTSSGMLAVYDMSEEEMRSRKCTIQFFETL